MVEASIRNNVLRIQSNLDPDVVKIRKVHREPGVVSSQH